MKGGRGAEEEEGDMRIYCGNWSNNPRITMSLVGTWNTNLLTWIVDTDAQLMNATVPSERIQWVISGGDKSAEGVWKKKIMEVIYFYFLKVK